MTWMMPLEAFTSVMTTWVAVIQESRRRLRRDRYRQPASVVALSSVTTVSAGHLTFNHVVEQDVTQSAFGLFQQRLYRTGGQGGKSVIGGGEDSERSARQRGFRPGRLR